MLGNDPATNERATSAKVALPHMSASTNTNNSIISPDELPVLDTDVTLHTKPENKSKTEKSQTSSGEDTEKIPASNLACDLTDAGLAQRFATQYRSKVRYCPALGWLVYNGSVWEKSENDALRLLHELTLDMLAQATAQHAIAKAELALLKTHDDMAEIQAQTAKLKEVEEVYKYAFKCRGTSKMKSVLNHAKCLLTVKREELDKDPYLLNTPSGTIDLKTGKLKPHDPNDFCTKITIIDPTNSTEDKQLLAFLSLIFCGDMELLHFAKVALGSALIGRVFEEALIIAHGDGSNGKSTFFNTIATILGSYSGKLPAVALTSKGVNAKHNLAELLGVRFCIAAETEEGMRLSTSMLKQIASTDRISAERKFCDPFDYEPSHLVILFTNHLPKVSSRDSGTWRRIKVMPFDAVIANPDTAFAEKLLKKSGGALLRWLIEGAQEFIANGHKFPPCEAVKHAGENYQQSNDWLQNFLDECVELGMGEVSAGDLYDRYYQWANATKDYPRTKADFKAALEGAGFEHRKTNKGARWAGILCVLPDKLNP